MLVSCKQLDVGREHFNLINGVDASVRLDHAPKFNSIHTMLTSAQGNELMRRQVGMLLLVFVDDCVSAPRVQKPYVSHRVFSLFKVNLLLESFFDILVVKRSQINLN